MDKTCRNCRFWRKGLSDRGTCDNVGMVEGDKSLDIRVTVADDHNLNYDLVTGPGFGCVNHEFTKEIQRSKS
jgi:hypothetical protein